MTGKIKAAVRRRDFLKMAAETPGGELAVTFAAWHTVVGVVPEGTRLALSFEWDSVFRDQDGNGLLEWLIEGDPRSTGSRGFR